jgi:hypothetical protein
MMPVASKTSWSLSTNIGNFASGHRAANSLATGWLPSIIFTSKGTPFS